MAFDMMREHGLFAKGIEFKFGKSKTSNGHVKFVIRKFRDGEIISAHPTTLFLSSVHVLRSSRESVRQTMLHEIAHALLPHMPNNPHGEEWKTLAASLGYTGGRLADGEDEMEHIRREALTFMVKNGIGTTAPPALTVGSEIHISGRVLRVDEFRRKNLVATVLSQDPKNRTNMVGQRRLVSIKVAENCVIR